MDINWQQLLVPETPLFELVLRGSAMYLAILVALRVLVRRHVGSTSLMDLLLMVLIADAAQNAMAAEYHSLTEGIVLCSTLIGWNYALDWLAYYSPVVGRLLEPPPLLVIKGGRLLKRNMRQEWITEDELLSQLRQQEIHELDQVQLAYIEPDGALSVVRTKDAPKKPDRPPKRGNALGA